MITLGEELFKDFLWLHQNMRARVLPHLPSDLRRGLEPLFVANVVKSTIRSTIVSQLLEVSR